MGCDVKGARWAHMCHVKGHFIAVPLYNSRLLKWAGLVVCEGFWASPSHDLSLHMSWTNWSVLCWVLHHPHLAHLCCIQQTISLLIKVSCLTMFVHINSHPIYCLLFIPPHRTSNNQQTHSFSCRSEFNPKHVSFWVKNVTTESVFMVGKHYHRSGCSVSPDKPRQVSYL